MNETAINGALAIFTWGIVAFLKWQAPNFWAKHNKLVKLGFVGLTASVLAAAAGSAMHQPAMAIAQGAVTAFLGAVFTRNALKAASSTLDVTPSTSKTATPYSAPDSDLVLRLPKSEEK